MEKYCICGHVKEGHSGIYALDITSCLSCYLAQDESKMSFYHDFQLDNLKYIEDLAKEKGLV